MALGNFGGGRDRRQPAATIPVVRALLAREGLRLPATAMETRQYLHGPMESVSAGR